MPNASPIYDPGQAFTGRATGGVVTGRRLVKAAAAKTDGNPVPIAHAGASDQPIGVAAADVAQNGDVAVYPPGIVLTLTAGAAIAAVGAVEVTTGGKVIPLNTGKKVGVALTTAVADLDPVLVQLQF